MTEAHQSDLNPAPGEPLYAKARDPLPGDLTPRRRTAGTSWLAWLSLAVAGGAAGLVWQGDQRWAQLEQTLVKRQQDSQTEAADARIAARQAQALAHETAAKAALLDAKLGELTAQRTQIDELLQSINRNRDDSLAADVEAVLQMSQQQATLMGNIEPLVAALRSIDERLMRMGSVRFETLRQAIVRDLEVFKTLPSANIATLAVRLDEAVAFVDAMPLRNAHPRAAARLASGSQTQHPALGAAGQVQGDVQHEATDTVTAPGALASSPAVAASMASAAQTQEGGLPPSDRGPIAAADAPPPEALPWWRRALTWWQPVWAELRGLVRVSAIEQPEAILIAPEQTYFLRENLKLKLLNARLSLLARQQGMVQSDLREALAAVERYFDTQSRESAALVSIMSEVAAQSEHVVIPRPEQTLMWLQTVMTPPSSVPGR